MMTTGAVRVLCEHCEGTVGAYHLYCNENENFLMFLSYFS
jgi:hypothetical protein